MYSLRSAPGKSPLFFGSQKESATAQKKSREIKNDGGSPLLADAHRRVAARLGLGQLRHELRHPLVLQLLERIRLRALRGRHAADEAKRQQRGGE